MTNVKIMCKMTKKLYHIRNMKSFCKNCINPESILSKKSNDS